MITFTRIRFSPLSLSLSQPSFLRVFFFPFVTSPQKPREKKETLDTKDDVRPRAFRSALATARSTTPATIARKWAHQNRRRRFALRFTSRSSRRGRLRPRNASIYSRRKKLRFPSGEFTDRGENILFKQQRRKRKRGHYSILRRARLVASPSSESTNGKTSGDVLLQVWEFERAEMSRRNRKQASTERVGVVAVVLVLGQTRGSSRYFRVLLKQRLPARALIQQQRVIFSGNRRPTDSKRLALLSQVHANRISSAKSPVLLRNAQNVSRVRRLWFRPKIHAAQQKRRFVPEKNLVRRLSRSRRLLLPAGRSTRRYFLP